MLTESDKMDPIIEVSPWKASPQNMNTYKFGCSSVDTITGVPPASHRIERCCFFLKKAVNITDFPISNKITKYNFQNKPGTFTNGDEIWRLFINNWSLTSYCHYCECCSLTLRSLFDTFIEAPFLNKGMETHVFSHLQKYETFRIRK